MLNVERLLADCLKDVRGESRAGAADPGVFPGTRGPAASGTAGEAADADDPVYRDARETFLTAGLAALNSRSRAGRSWTQHNLSVRRGALPELYAHLDATVGRARRTGRVGGFFFLHKDPGLRMRMEAPVGVAEQLCGSLPGRLLYGPPVRVPYEPETYLFGGPDSMEHVHELFTADSFAWLDQHTRPAQGTQAPADWRLSLLLLREVHAGLGIAGWEHRGVWETLRREAGRGLGTCTDSDVRRAARGIAAYWRLSPSEMYAALPARCAHAVRERGAALRAAAERWRTGYFESGAASTGPRTAAAYFTVFHWNRARLSHARQSLLTDALADGGR